MKVKELLRHTQDCIFVRLEQCGTLVAEGKSSALEKSLSASVMTRSVGLIDDANENEIRVSILPLKG